LIKLNYNKKVKKKTYKLNSNLLLIIWNKIINKHLIKIIIKKKIYFKNFKILYNNSQ